MNKTPRQWPPVTLKSMTTQNMTQKIIIMIETRVRVCPFMEKVTNNGSAKLCNFANGNGH